MALTDAADLEVGSRTRQLRTSGRGAGPSARFHSVEPSDEIWPQLAELPERPIGREWLHFVADTQRAIPVVAELREGGARLGYFVGSIVTKFGVRILGSPFPRWMTPYMGFVLADGVPRIMALAALERFAFDDLRCAHVELLDRYLTAEEAQRAGYSFALDPSYETDLTGSEERLFSRMTSACRRCIRKAEKGGVIVEEARADRTFVDEYYAQLKDGLLRKRRVPSYDAARVAKLLEHVAPAGRLLLLRARDPDGRCVATGIYPAMNRTAHQWGTVASYVDGRHLRPAEMLNWYAMRYWKARGMQFFDWGGAGRHKAKYGGHAIDVVRARKSRSEALARLRDAAETILRQRLRLRGHVASWWNGVARPS